MTSEVVYFSGPDGASNALEMLEHLHPKTLARSLAFIDLLEEPNLPYEIDRPLGQEPLDEFTPHNHLRATRDQKPDKLEKPRLRLRVLNAYSGRTKLRFAYTRVDGKTVILGAGRNIRGAERSKLLLDYERSLSIKANGKASKESRLAQVLKSHREFVAELTLSDPVRAAHYTKARERAQFALSLLRLRDKAQFTNETLAERTGLRLSLIKSLTRGRLPKLDTMRRLVDALQARIIIEPGGGISLEPHESQESPAKDFATHSPKMAPSHAHVIEPVGVGDFLVLQ